MKPPKAVTTRVWVSREPDYEVSYRQPYSMWTKEPHMETNGWWGDDEMRTDFIGAVSVEEFEGLTGFRLKPGECRQVDMTITMVPVDDTKGGAE